MPEIKNTFTGGKMNKDLDERLVPSGEYRDALNVGIGRSEGADIGALENLLGNQLVGPDGTVTSTEVNVIVPGTDPTTEILNDEFRVTAYSPGTPATQPTEETTRQVEFTVSQYTPSVPGTMAQTQTLTLNERLRSPRTETTTTGTTTVSVDFIGNNSTAGIPGGELLFNRNQQAAANMLRPGATAEITLLRAATGTAARYTFTVVEVRDRRVYGTASPIDPASGAANFDVSVVRGSVSFMVPTTTSVTVGGNFNYAFNTGSSADGRGGTSFPAGTTTLTGPNGVVINITFATATTAGQDNSFTTTTTFDFPAGTQFSFTTGETVPATPAMVIVTGQAPVVGDTIFPRGNRAAGVRITNVSGGPQTWILTLSADISPAPLVRSTLVIDEIVPASPGTPATPATITLERSSAEIPAIVDGEMLTFMNESRRISAVMANGNSFSGTLSDMYMTAPSIGSSVVTRQRVVTTPGTPPSNTRIENHEFTVVSHTEAREARVPEPRDADINYRVISYSNSAPAMPPPLVPHTIRLADSFDSSMGTLATGGLPAGTRQGTFLTTVISPGVLDLLLLAESPNDPRSPTRPEVGGVIAVPTGGPSFTNDPDAEQGQPGSLGFERLSDQPQDVERVTITGVTQMGSGWRVTHTGEFTVAPRFAGYFSARDFGTGGGILYNFVSGVQSEASFASGDMVTLTPTVGDPVTITFTSAASPGNRATFTTSDTFAFGENTLLTFSTMIGSGTPAVKTQLTVTRLLPADAAPTVDEVIVIRRAGEADLMATIGQVTPNGDNFDLVLNADLDPAPVAGGTVSIVRQIQDPPITARDAVVVVDRVNPDNAAPMDTEEFILGREPGTPIETVTMISTNRFSVVLEFDFRILPNVGDTLLIARTVQATTTQTTDIGVGTCIGSIRDQAEDKVYWFTTGGAATDSPDAIYEFNQATNEIVTIIQGNLNFSTENLITGINIIEGYLYWTDDRNEPRKININKWRDAAHTGTIPTRIFGRQFQERDITVIRPHPTERIEVQKFIDIESDNPPFEEVFPQFGYRWRYDDGEYSPYSFFTEEVFTPAPYSAEDHYKEGYNTAIRNVVTTVELSNIPKGGPDVVAVDLLYRESISQTIYNLRTVRNTDDEWGADPNYIEQQSFSKRSFYAALPNEQLTRPFDDVPRLAKAQEITANRLVYGNYLRNYNQSSTIDMAVGQTNFESSNGISVKGNRDYEVGVSYIDQFGRQGGLITNGDAYTTLFSTTDTQRLTAQIASDPPDWATHYKYFVKESSMDHHNLVAYNTFNDGDATQNNSEFVWLQFPSNDRNKVSEDTFLVPRRHTHGDVTTNSGNTLAGTPLELTNTPTFNATSGALGRTNSRRRALWTGSRGIIRGGSGGALPNGGVYTAPVAGEYTFEFTGTLNFVSRSRRWRSPAWMIFQTGFDIVDSNGNGTLVPNSNVRLGRINAPGRPAVIPISRTFRINLEAGQRITPVLFRSENQDRSALNMELRDIRFGTIQTPVDPNLPAPAFELPGFCVPEFSRHAAIEIENEAPDIVRAQLPVDLRRLGTTINYGTGNDDVFLVQSFDAPHRETPDATGYNEASTELYYQSGNNNNGFRDSPLFPALNIILDREGIERLIVRPAGGLPTDPADRVITVDVSEVEGGLFLGVGAANSLPQTGVAGKVRINEISLGYDDSTDSSQNSERSIVRFTLAEPIGVAPENMPITVFKGDITENALKNLTGSFFVKVARATGNEIFPFIPTGQSQFDADNNVTTLQSIWFETLPLGEESNLNLYWEATESLPISRHGQRDDLDFFNCIAVTDDCVFIETQRIYDRFNSVQIQKGLRVNIPQENYEEERRLAGLIYSGIFNSRTTTNRLNQFIYANGITKELEPNYGSIQKLHTRDTNLISFCEDKVFKILADKDQLFNADGGGNVSASNAVLGQTTPYVGEYGISKNPESFATYGSRIYFSDRARGVIMRLAQNGLEEISRNGMADYFRDELRVITGPVWGSFDDYHNQFNLTLNGVTISFDDDVQGWPSRKSFITESGLSLNNLYYTFSRGQLWLHNSRRVPRNNFYGTQYRSTITTIFNQEPSSIKNFKTFNYEGTQGWTAPLIITDQEAGRVLQFQNKEGKWFECVSALGNAEIIGVINDEITDDMGGPDRFFDGDAVEDGDLGEGDVYDFGDSTGDEGDDGGDMGIGPADEITDGDGMPLGDDDQPEEVNIEFYIVDANPPGPMDPDPVPMPGPPTPPVTNNN